MVRLAKSFIPCYDFSGLLKAFTGLLRRNRKTVQIDEVTKMKKTLWLCSVLILSALIAAAACADETHDLPSVDRLLRYGDADARIEVNDDLDAYSIYNGQWSELSDGELKMIILERRSAEKEFTELKVYPPFGDDEGFSDDFEGVDIGRSRLWLRGDLMQKLPSYLRAGSLSEATHLIIAEDIYFPSSTLILTDYKKKDNEDIPEFETAEEMVSYFLAHQPEVESKTYYPVFGSYAFLSIYETSTKRGAIYDAQMTPGRMFARNPEASLQWNHMSEVLGLMNALTDENDTDRENAKTLIGTFDFIPQAETDLWNACLNARKYDVAYQLAGDALWEMAEDLKNLDPSEENRKNYELIIRDKNILALAQYAQYCDYSGFEQSMDSIRNSKEYLAAPDWEWLESAFRDMIDEMFGG